MKKTIAALLIIIFFTPAIAQKLQRPKLVVGIVVDQMRWDYLYRFYDRYDENGGFKRMLKGGFSCENTMIPYAPTVTACGHSSIYTGSVPAINGITGNAWWDKEQMRSVYCTEDKSVKTVGSSSGNGMQSPANLLVNTICDELKLATNFKSKVIGIAMKDRGGILTAGHTANAAYWYDNTVGNWITSTYYMNELPRWAIDFNNKKWVDHYYNQGWNTLFPIGTYEQGNTSEKNYKGKPFGSKFPYQMKNYIGKDYGKISPTPFGNSLTIEFAKAAITGEDLGSDDITDFLAVSFSSPDYIGHTFGPYSVESEDGFLRLDRELGDFLTHLDNKVGKNNYTVFLSADHGVAPIPEYRTENKLPGGRAFMGQVTKTLNENLFATFKIKGLVVNDYNYQMHLNHHAIDSANLNADSIAEWIADYLSSEPGIARAFPVKQMNTVPLPEVIRKMLNNGYYPRRNGDVQYILQPGYIDAYGTTGTTHGLWNPYDAHIPLLWYGWGIKQGKMHRETYMTDIAPTLAALLRIQMPDGSVGKVIEEVLK